MTNSQGGSGAEGGGGISMDGAEVELVDVAIVHCHSFGISARSTATATAPSQLAATRCEISNNGGIGLMMNNAHSLGIHIRLKNCISHHNLIGIWADGKGVVHVYGDDTAIHSNKIYGIFALGNKTKVVIHLPSHHNTSYNNIRNDRTSGMGSTITNVED